MSSSVSLGDNDSSRCVATHPSLDLQICAAEEVTKPASEWGRGYHSKAGPRHRPARLTSSALGGFPDAEKPCSNRLCSDGASSGRTGAWRTEIRQAPPADPVADRSRVRNHGRVYCPVLGHAQGTRLASLPGHVEKNCTPLAWPAPACAQPRLRAASLGKPGDAAGRCPGIPGPRDR